MSSSSHLRVFKGCRVLMAAAKGNVTKSRSVVVGGAPDAATEVKAKAKQPKRRTTAAAAATTSSSGKDYSNTGILKVQPVSPALGKFVGAPEVSRTDATKKIWEHIKLNNLQNPDDKRIIHCDRKLKTIFEWKDKVGFLEIAKLLSPHFVKTGE